MTELQNILEALDRLRGTADRAILATLVRVDGSAYRAPGARMLIVPEGRSTGVITGPCLEAELARQAAALSPSHAPRLVTYDTTSDAEAMFGYGLGCRGIVHILLESIDPTRPPAYLEALRSSLVDDRATAMASVYAVHGDCGVPLGARLMVWDEGFTLLGDWPADLAGLARRDGRQVLASGRPRSARYALPAGQVDVFIEPIRRPSRLLIIGAVDGAIPLVRLASELAWHVTVADRRPAYADAARFPQADAVICCPLAELPRRVDLTRTAAAVIMTHHYPDDLELLRALLPSAVPYIGLLGSRQRARRMLDELAGDGPVQAAEKLGRLHAPVGLDIGAETPAQIALSILAEIHAALAARPGTPLRERSAPIHARPEGP